LSHVPALCSSFKLCLPQLSSFSFLLEILKNFWPTDIKLLFSSGDNDFFLRWEEWDVVAGKRKWLIFSLPFSSSIYHCWSL
jgi:hypothetical protein